MAQIEIKDLQRSVKYYMDDRLKSNLDKSVVEALAKKDKDFVMCIDGAEGVGKSTLAMQIGRYVDPTLDLNRVVFDAESFREAILKAKKGQCIIYDEAFTGFSSRSALSGINRALVSLAMQMRQKNLFIIIVLPTIFLLDKYLALFRTKVLIHCYENKGIRGYFRVYPTKLKKMLIMSGVKTYSYKVRTNFKGRYYGVFALGDEKLDKKYREKKEKALNETSKDPMHSVQIRFKEQRDLLMYLYLKDVGLSARKFEQYLKDYDFDISHVQISKIIGKFGLNRDKDAKNSDLDQETDENEENLEENDENNLNNEENEDLEQKMPKNELKDEDFEDSEGF